jgi:hypothetical protein
MQSQKEKLDASKCGWTQQHTITKSVVKIPSNNRMHSLAFVLTISQQPNQLQLSFINVNIKPAGEIGCQQM